MLLWCEPGIARRTARAGARAPYRTVEDVIFECFGGPREAELARRGAVESTLDSNPGVNSAFAYGMVFARV